MYNIKQNKESIVINLEEKILLHLQNTFDGDGPHPVCERLLWGRFYESVSAVIYE
jgi:hypothetical protein